MIKNLQNIHPIIFLIIATVLEVSGDAIIRKSMYNHVGMARIALMILGAILLFGYGFFLNLAPVEFAQVVGLYVATLFIVWQVINYISFHTLPTIPIIVGGSLVVIGGLIITFWKT
jgi:small multidrug resistance family-3 protein